MKRLLKVLTIVFVVVMVMASACQGRRAGGGLTVEPGVLIMATNAEFPPYEFWEGGRIVGIDAEIAEAIANKLGLTLRIDDMDFNAILPAVTGGRADMGMAGMTITEERMQNVDFSTSYATGVQVIIVRDGSSITNVSDLYAEGANFVIGVQESTTGDLYVTWDLEEEGLATVQRYRRGADAVQALVTGRVDLVVIDNEPARAFVAMNRGLHILETEFKKEDYAIAFAKGSPLRDAVDAALRELIADGTVQYIIDKYITAN
jgi:polar amino acid transport system substrate-binding protein